MKIVAEEALPWMKMTGFEGITWRGAVRTERVSVAIGASAGVGVGKAGMLGNEARLRAE